MAMSFWPNPATAAGKITVCATNATAKADKTLPFVSSGFFLSIPIGLAFLDAYLYVGDLRGIWRISYKDGQTVAGTRKK